MTLREKIKSKILLAKIKSKMPNVFMPMIEQDGKKYLAVIFVGKGLEDKIKRYFEIVEEIDGLPTPKQYCKNLKTGKVFWTNEKSKELK